MLENSHLGRFDREKKKAKFEAGWLVGVTNDELRQGSLNERSRYTITRADGMTKTSLG